VCTAGPAKTCAASPAHAANAAMRLKNFANKTFFIGILLRQIKQVFVGR
jgi:hypothetical protein